MYHVRPGRGGKREQVDTEMLPEQWNGPGDLNGGWLGDWECRPRGMRVAVMMRVVWQRARVGSNESCPRETRSLSAVRRGFVGG